MAVASRPPRSRPVKRAGAGGAKATGATTGTKSGRSSSSGQTRSTKALAHGPARPARGTVSRTSAQRFAARVRARRRRRGLIVVLAGLVLAGVGWLAFRSPWAMVQRVRVTGTDRVAPGVVRDAARSEVGHPMLLARTADIAARVREQRLVRSVTVTRHWPGTLVVTVVEREPVAAVPAGAGQVALVDPDGVLIESVATARKPAGLPRIEVGIGPADAATLRGCLAVLHGLPAALSARLIAIGADTPDGIWLTLREPGAKGRPALKGGARVEWGNATATPHKAEVLTALLAQHAVNYDVRSPDTPAVRRK